MIRLTTMLLAAVVALAPASPASAYINAFAWTGDYGVSLAIGESILAPEYEKLAKLNAETTSADDEPSPATRAKPTTAATVDVTRLNYASTSARTRTNIANFAEKGRKVDPKGAAAMVALFETTDVMAALEVEMRKNGLTKNNVADAYTIWWTHAWLATQGRNDDLPRAQLQIVRGQAADVLVDTPDLVGASDEQKQELAEALLVQAMLIGASVDMAREQPALMAPLKAAVAKGAKASGLDLAAMTLTNEGFRMAGAK